MSPVSAYRLTLAFAALILVAPGSALGFAWVDLSSVTVRPDSPITPADVIWLDVLLTSNQAAIHVQAPPQVIYQGSSINVNMDATTGMLMMLDSHVEPVPLTTFAPGYYRYTVNLGRLSPQSRSGGFTVVPEPTTISLLIGGFLLIRAQGHRRLRRP